MFGWQVMHKELNRLATYSNWTPLCGARPSRLARSGFYATDGNDTAVCFACHSLVNNWQPGDDPKQKHRQEKPACSLIDGQNSTNVPMVPLRDDFDGNDSAYRSQRGSGDVRDSAAVTPPTNFMHTCRSALNRARQKGVLGTEQPAACLDNPDFNPRFEGAANSLYAHDAGPPASRHAASVVDVGYLTNPDFDLLRHEGERLATFTGTNFPTNCPVTSSALAKAGFFYMGPGDRVQCAFCSVVLYVWKDGDDPMTEHKKHRADCPFVNNEAHHRNVCIEDNVNTYVATGGTCASDSVSTRQEPQVSISSVQLSSCNTFHL